MIVLNDQIIYRKRFLTRIKEKKVDISKATKILFDGRLFESASGKCWRCFYIFIEKEDRKILINGSDNVRAEKRMAKKIGQFLNLPVEEIHC